MANDGIRVTSPATRIAASRCFAALAIQAFLASPPNAAASDFLTRRARRRHQPGPAPGDQAEQHAAQRDSESTTSRSPRVMRCCHLQFGGDQ